MSKKILSSLLIIGIISFLALPVFSEEQTGAAPEQEAAEAAVEASARAHTRRTRATRARGRARGCGRARSRYALRADRKSVV